MTKRIAFLSAILAFAAPAAFAAEPAKELVADPKTVTPVDYAKTRPIGLKAAEAAEKLGWRLGSQAYTLRDRPLLDALDALHGLGILYVECYPGQVISKDIKDKFGPGMSEAATAAVRKKLEETGIKVLSFGVTGVPADEAGAKKLAEWAKSFGIERIVTEAGAKQFDVMDKVGKEVGIEFALHNHPEPNIYGKPEKVLEALKGREIGQTTIGACADIGHWQRSGVKPVDGLKLLEGRVFEFHFKDLDRFGVAKGAKDVPWGTGKGDVAAVLAACKRQAGKMGGKSGKPTFNIEYETGNGHALVSNMAKCVEWFGAECEKLAK